jgi:NAD(P)-dependent dehydrogenase (short-subunit alcohol dehydrogenase family)
VADPWRYDGRRTVVTGCSSGIGEAVAVELRGLGADVVGLDVNEPTVDIDRFVRLDLRDAASIDAVVADLGDVDALFNCAGISGANPARDVYLVNFLGTRHFTERVLAGMRTGATVVSVSSLGAARWADNLEAVLEAVKSRDVAAGLEWIDAHPEQITPSGYNFAKQCLLVWTMERALEVAPEGKRMNVVSPSPVDTPMLAQSAVAVGASYLDRFPRPLGRNAQPIEVARPMIFLNSEAASYINGHNLWIDGGFMAGTAIGAIDRTLIAGVPGQRRG